MGRGRATGKASGGAHGIIYPALPRTMERGFGDAPGHPQSELSHWNCRPGRRLLRVREAAEYLSISAWKLRRLVQDGLLPIVQDRDGGAWRVDVRDLDGFIERNKRTVPR
jgi:excisionase family DNA binding protein